MRKKEVMENIRFAYCFGTKFKVFQMHKRRKCLYLQLDESLKLKKLYHNKPNLQPV